MNVNRESLSVRDGYLGELNLKDRGARRPLSFELEWFAEFRLCRLESRRCDAVARQLGVAGCRRLALQLERERKPSQGWKQFGDL